jgi:hypothetical protein
VAKRREKYMGEIWEKNGVVSSGEWEEGKGFDFERGLGRREQDCFIFLERKWLYSLDE